MNQYYNYTVLANVNIGTYFMSLHNSVSFDQYIVAYWEMEELVLSFDSFASWSDDDIFAENYEHAHFDATQISSQHDFFFEYAIIAYLNIIWT